jgi:hypothetical protein
MQSAVTKEVRMEGETDETKSLYRNKHPKIRDDPESVAKRLWTREWWEYHGFRFELLTAPPVLDELERGDYPTKQEVLQFVAAPVAAGGE